MRNTQRQDNFAFIRTLSAYFLFTFIAALWLTVTAAAQNINYTVNNLDQTLRGGANVDPRTLNMSFSVTLNDYSGRGLGLPFSLNYASKLWRIQFRNTLDGNGTTFTDTIARYAEHSVAGWTASVDPVWAEYSTQSYDSSGQPDCRDCPGYPGTSYWIGRVILHMPNGGTHELRRDNEAPVLAANPPPMSGSYVAVDGSRIKFSIDGSTGTQTAYLPDGSRYVIYTPSGVFPPTNNIAYIDRHGNTLNYNAAMHKWTDTLGRQIGLTHNISVASAGRRDFGKLAHLSRKKSSQS